MAQGVGWDKEKIIELMKPKLKLGYSITKACKVIGFPQSTFATWLQNDRELRLKVFSWKNNISDKARKNLKEKILSGSEEESRWWLERKEKDEFSTRTEEITAETTIDDLLKELNDESDREAQDQEQEEPNTDVQEE